jgi:putative methyltransferase (TIGR04325 family)
VPLASKIAILELIIQLVKQLTPPILFSLARKIIVRKKGTPYLNHSGLQEFRSYEDALLHCSSKGYENSEVVSVVLDKTLAFDKRFEKNSTLDYGSTRIISALGLSTAAGSIRVLDFGGACGHHFDIATRAFAGKLDLKWNVVETTAMANIAGVRRDPKLKFFDDIQAAQDDLGTVDLVFSSGTLHCCHDPLAILKDLINVNPKYIFITRTALIEQKESVVIIQKSSLSSNGPGPLNSETKDAEIYYPNVLVCRESFEEALTERYEIKFKVVEDVAVFRAREEAVNLHGYFCVRRD